MLREFGRDDDASVATYVAISNACLAQDAAFWHPTTFYRQQMAMTHGFDGEVGRHFLVEIDGVEQPVGIVGLYSSDYDNLDRAWVELAVSVEHRRRGVGTAAQRAAFDEVKARGRTKVGWFGWDTAQTRGFAAATGFEPKSVAVLRRQHLQELEPGLADRRYAEAEPHASEYDVVRMTIPTPEEQLPALTAAIAAINDAPLDDLELEDEVFTPERTRAFEQAQLASNYRVYRVVARHRESGELAGLTVVSVDGETPTIAHQLDTSVVRSHRGHRLGLLLKADMMRWLAEAEPQLLTVDTFNAESNDHMVSVNELLGYQVMGRELQYQGSI